MQMYPSSSDENLYSSHGGPHYLSTILLKDFDLFKIAKSF